MKKLGILTHQINNTQKCMSINYNLNKICEIEPKIDPIVFYNDLGIIAQKHKFAIMQTIEALDYDGILIATDDITAHLLPNCLCAKKKYFYIWEPNWHTTQRPVQFIKDMYMNDDIDLICRSQDHYDLISRIFKKPQHIIEDFDYEQIIQNIVYT